MAGQRVGIVGGGISGLAAAWHLVEADPTLQVVLLDGSDRPGGSSAVGWSPGSRPTSARSRCWPGDRRRSSWPVPSGSATWWSTPPRAPPPSGAEARSTPCRRALSWGCPARPPPRWASWTRRRSPAPRASATGRTSPSRRTCRWGEFVEQRMGRAVVDRLVEPLLGGVYAGHARRLSLQAAVPALWGAARSGESISVVAERAASAVPATRGPVFAGPDGGVFQLARTLTSVLTARGVRILSDTTVRAVERAGRGWRLVAAPCRRRWRRLWTRSSWPSPQRRPRACWRRSRPRPRACLPRSLTRPWPSSTLALPRPGLPPLPGSGFLVPPVDGRTIKAATFSANKWSWVQAQAPDLFLLRTSSAGGEEAQLQRSDGELVAVALADLSGLSAPACPHPSTAASCGGAAPCPQYTVATSTGWPASGRTGGGRGPRGRRRGVRRGGRSRLHQSGRAAAVATLTHLRSPAAAGENEGMSPKPYASQIREINDSIRYAMWSVFQASSPLPEDRDGIAAEVEALSQSWPEGVVVRGVYDVAGLRADADFMIWWHAEDRDRAGRLPPAAAHRARTRTHARLVDSALHRPAEFNKSHIPAFLADEEAKRSSASTRSCAPTTGTSCTTSNAAPCWPSTARWPVATPTSAPTPSPRSRSATTSGSWPSRPTSCTASST